MTSELLFTWGPYIAAFVGSVGLVVAFVIADRRGAASAAQDSSNSHSFAAKVCRIGFLLLVLGHVGGVLFPAEIVRWSLNPFRLFLLEGAGLLIGVVVLSIWTMSAWRHIVQARGSAVHRIADEIFLACIFVEMITGLLMAVLCRWASLWAASTLTPYVRSIFAGEPATALATGLPFVVQAHVFPVFVMLAVFPFTGIGSSMVSVTWLGIRQLRAFVVTRAASSCEFLWQRLAPQNWIWPEEEE